MHAGNVHFHDAAKYGCDHHDAINKMKIRLKTRRHTIPAFRFVVERTTKVAQVSDAASRVMEAMDAKLAVHAAANVVELFVRALVVL